jgi:hypothetical protein
VKLGFYSVVSAGPHKHPGILGEFEYAQAFQRWMFEIQARLGFEMVYQISNGV